MYTNTQSPLQAPGNKLGIDTLVRVSIDAFKVGKGIKGDLKDGFQPFKDVPNILFRDYAKIQFIIENGKVAGQEILDLTPDELEEFEARVSEGAEIPNEGVAGKARKAIRLAARAYRLILEALDIVEEAQEIF